MPNRRQAFILTNADLIHWCIYAALGGDKLNGGFQLLYVKWLDKPWLIGNVTENRHRDDIWQNMVPFAIIFHICWWGWANMICHLKIMVFHWKVFMALVRRHLCIQYKDAIAPVQQYTLRKCQLKTILSPQQTFVQWQDTVTLKWSTFSLKWSTFSKSSYLNSAMIPAMG